MSIRSFVRSIFCLGSIISTSIYAFSINDDTGRMMTFEAPAQRIISLAPSITENLFSIGVGERIVGTTASSDFPEAAKKLQIIGDYQSVDIEKIASLKPDVIIAWQGGNSPAQIAALERLNIPVYFHRVETLADIPTSLMRLAQLTGVEQSAASTIITAYQHIPLLNQANTTKLPAFYQVWSTPLMTLGHNSWVTDALARCGARNIFDDISLAAPSVNIEDVLNRQPAIIATATPNAQIDNSLDNWKAWPKLPVVRVNGFIYTDADSMNRATLRTLSATAKMCNDINAIRARL